MKLLCTQNILSWLTVSATQSATSARRGNVGGNFKATVQLDNFVAGQTTKNNKTMVPIFEQGHGQGIGHSFGSFLKRFINICEGHLDNKRAKAFAFILYNFQDTHIKDDILKNQGGFAQLDRLSGKDLSVFYLHSDNRRLLKAFNEIFLGAFEIKSEYRLPFVLFFKVADREVTDVEVVELEQTDLLFAFQELYNIIDNYIARSKDIGIEKIKPKANKLTEFLQTVKKISLDKFIKWLIDKGAEKAKEYI